MEEKMKAAPNYSKALLQSKELYQYILDTSVFPNEPEPLKELREVSAGHPRSRIGTAPDAGQLMAILLKLINPKRTIEIGVFTGYSLLLTALTIPEDGKIIAIDVDHEAYEMGLPVIKKAGVEHKVNFINAEALRALDDLIENLENEGSFDFAYVDADKVNYLNYFERLMKLIKVGGVVIFDNTLWKGTVAMPEDAVAENYKEIRKRLIEFNNLLANDTRI
ncbi:hypothetical protein BT93_L3876 [Corymbia citriodora subsp. variegata]|uniref:Caffeoyl-CoA O-methyltransferase n=1 Tax=Corymbia citriodora subsp. variegata TaxID=360336 RepID=A0A8T0CV15_CORYI|nr:hypothetical protein BT93_L3876 [Corymbia citriodora subsp. variegata]